MEETSKFILEYVGLDTQHLSGQMIPRETLLNNAKYDELKTRIPELKKLFSSSALTSLQKTAEQSQKWPLLNLIRQILNGYKYQMKPIRKSDGYTALGVKKYKRFFLISLMLETNAISSP